MKTSDFDFELPVECIAQTAVEPRDHARLLRVSADGMQDHHVYDLPDLLRAGDVLVMNDTRVIPARLYGKRGDVRIEILLHKKQAAATWLAGARAIGWGQSASHVAAKQLVFANAPDALAAMRASSHG